MQRPRWNGPAAVVLIALLLVAGSALLLGAVALGDWRAATAARREGLSDLQVQTLRSLAQVDDYPLYTMRYQGAYRQAAGETAGPDGVRQGAWACSLFAALGDPEALRLGRNFDWEYSPALLLFTNPPDGYASVSMVDMAYLGFDGERANGAAELPIVERRALLDAPFLPFDGMNEHGLAVGMAAVPSGDMSPDPFKPTIGSLGVIREMLDRARTVDEAMAVLDEYNVDMTGGPPVHYLIADRSGRAVLVEFYRGERVVLPNRANWHAATNFLRSEAGGTGEGRCARYDRIVERLEAAEGRVSAGQAMDLLAEVSQQTTQWSVVYSLSEGRLAVSMGRRYRDAHDFELAGSTP